ncbi:MAG TPA: 2,3,4,5-tetrahydropyridine-2,6-dicarboxylate N-succinyltransferase [Gemmatimonadales bacterium]|jgi:2,3,4,5-tetrahydropyridine-2-carboxylate N-succinyltransferase
MELSDRIFALSERKTFGLKERKLFAQFRAMLAHGEIRAAERQPSGLWYVNAWVKLGILAGFRMGVLADMSVDKTLRFFDKDTLPTRPTKTKDKVRIVPGGSSVRDGAYLAPGVVCMPPMYVNIGAYVDENTMIDSHALVGSCAQIGKRVHLSAAAQVGGVLEPVGALPVIVEDDVMVGGGCGIYEGTIVRERAVLAPGTILTGSTPVYDLVKNTVYRRTPGGALEIPAGAVVVPGSRKAPGGSAMGVSLYAPVIVKYRDERTNAATALEEALR